MYRTADQRFFGAEKNYLCAPNSILPCLPLKLSLLAFFCCSNRWHFFVFGIGSREKGGLLVVHANGSSNGHKELQRAVIVLSSGVPLLRLYQSFSWSLAKTRPNSPHRQSSPRTQDSTAGDLEISVFAQGPPSRNPMSEYLRQYLGAARREPDGGSQS